MRNKGFITRVQQEAHKEFMDREVERMKTNHIVRMQTLDKVTITLGRMGFTPDQLVEFQEKFLETEHDYITEVINDGKDDKEIWYAKKKIDDALREYVRPDMFVPYDERYSI